MPGTFRAGQFLTVLLNVLILAFINFLMTRAATWMIGQEEQAASGPTEVELLGQIRDELRKR